MYLRRLTLIVLALLSSPAAAQDSDVIRLFSPVRSGPTAAPPPAAIAASQPAAPPARPAPAIRGAFDDGIPAAAPPSAADRTWTVALPAPTPAPFQPVR
jgi:hypothetical protein